MRHIKKFEGFNKGPKGKNLTVFVRFGNLDHNKKQKGYGKDGFHSPPAPRGFFSMPKVAQEFFLIGSLNSTQQRTQFPKERTEDGTWDDYWERVDKVRSNIRKEFIKKDGTIWHHLGDYCKPNEVLKRHNSWVKTEMSTWRKAFMKSSLNDRYGSGDFKSDSINKTRGIEGYYSKDHYEVFFDEKV